MSMRCPVHTRRRSKALYDSVRVKDSAIMLLRRSVDDG
jgi:hypothetical protein